MKKITLYQKALNTSMHSRFVARAEAEYLIDALPHAGLELAEIKRAMKELQKIVRR